MSGDELFALPSEERKALGLRTLARPDDASSIARNCNLPRVSARAFTSTFIHTTVGARVGKSDTPNPIAASTTNHIHADTANHTCLELHNIDFAYRDHPVLSIDHLAIPTGAVTALTGPNGAGKTTLARLICGLERIPTHKHGIRNIFNSITRSAAADAQGSTAQGSITLAGTPLTEKQRMQSSYLVMQDVNRQLFSDSALHELTVGLPRREASHTDGMAILERFGLAHKAPVHPLALSGGQKQRLVIAAAQAYHKQIYVFDEPTSGVDWRHLRTIVDELRSLADAGHVVLVITHDMEFLAAAPSLPRVRSVPSIRLPGRISRPPPPGAAG